MKRYFRYRDQTLDGYTAYYEYDGEWVTRQIDLFQGSVLLLVPPESSDLRLSESNRDPSDEISSEWFNQLWETYANQLHGTKRADSPLLNPPWFYPGKPGSPQG